MKMGIKRQKKMWGERRESGFSSYISGDLASLKTMEIIVEKKVFGKHCLKSYAVPPDFNAFQYTIF